MARYRNILKIKFKRIFPTNVSDIRSNTTVIRNAYFKYFNKKSKYDVSYSKKYFGINNTNNEQIFGAYIV